MTVLLLLYCASVRQNQLVPVLHPTPQTATVGTFGAKLAKTGEPPLTTSTPKNNVGLVLTHLLNE